MELFHSPECYLFNLKTTSSKEAKKIWRQTIKEEWNFECAYCGSQENLTLDHVIPQSLGGLDISQNVVCCCKNCNHNKGNKKWDEWFFNQNFFSEEKYEKIINWISPKKSKNLYPYRLKRNNCT